MRFTKEQYEEVRINMDPMIDCVFLLIIFFLATTAFIKLEQDLSINLPTMSEQLKVKKPPAAPIALSPIPGFRWATNPTNIAIPFSFPTAWMPR